MDKKKLFGTILGVTLFGILITGATFAWLTFGVTVGDDLLTANTLNFIVEFDGGSDVNNLPILDSNYIEAKDAGVVKVVLKKNPSSPNGHASIWLNTTSDTKMTKDSVVRWVVCRDPNVEASGEQIDNVCGNKVLMENDQPKYETSNPYSGPLNHGIITGSGPIPLLSDALLADSNGLARGSNAVTGCKTTSGLSMCPVSLTNKDMLMSSGVSYFVYMWLEAEPIVNQHLDEQYYKTGTTDQYKVGGGGTPDYDSGIKFSLYSGFVFASATQTDGSESGVEDVVASGLYDSEGNFTSWSTLVSLDRISVDGTTITDVDTTLTGELVIPEGITSIGTYAFEYTILSNVILPSTLMTIENSAFSEAFINGDLIIPEGVTTIGSYAFMYAGFKSVIIPKTVTSIGDQAFDSAQLTSIVIPEGITKIGMSTFYHSSLESIVIPKSVTVIENNAFSLTQLTDVYYEGSQEEWNNISISNENGGNDLLINANKHYNYK